MNPPKFIGRVVYFFGYPIFRVLIRGTHRAYVLIVCNDEVLVTKNWLGFQKKLRLPGGGIHRNESARTAASRELIEELGLSTDEDNLEVLTTAPLNTQHKYSYELFLLRLKTKPTLRIDNREIISATFMTFLAVKNQPQSEELSTALQLANLVK